MAQPSVQSLCEQLFPSFVAPLVLGGDVTPGKPFGGRRALRLREGATPADTETLSHLELARVRVARKIAPVDRMQPAPTGDEWALFALLHDLVQSTHPGFDTLLRRMGPARILTVVEAALERIAPPANVGDALSRHTWFSRMFELTRTDVELHWWTGHRTFLGEDPPARLLAWPDVRRVQQLRTQLALMDLPGNKAIYNVTRFGRAVTSFLRRTPLTDLATMTRATPAFVWTDATVSLVATNGGRTMALRALAQLPARAVDHTLGRATRLLLYPEHREACRVALRILAERAVTLAIDKLENASEAGIATGAPTEEEIFATSVGASEALQLLAETGGDLSDDLRTAVMAFLNTRATTRAAHDVRAFLSNP